MLIKISGRLIFTYGGPKKEYHKPIRANFKLSLLGALIGIFLLPNIAFLSAITPEKLIELTNRERQAQGLNPLTANQLLTQAAILKGKTILETNIFKHTINDRKFSAWIRDTGYNYSYVGENLAVDFNASEAVIEAWKNSPAHKQNLLSPYYREIGVSALPGKFQGQDTTVIVQIFGAPAVSSLTPGEVNPAAEFLNSGLPANKSLANWQYNKTENLLTHAIISQELRPLYEDKLILPAHDYRLSPLNKFIIQPDHRLAVFNFLIIFLFFAFIYSLIFFYYYSFLKINKTIF